MLNLLLVNRQWIFMKRYARCIIELFHRTRKINCDVCKALIVEVCHLRFPTGLQTGSFILPTIYSMIYYTVSFLMSILYGTGLKLHADISFISVNKFSKPLIIWCAQMKPLNLQYFYRRAEPEMQVSLKSFTSPFQMCRKFGHHGDLSRMC